MEILSAIREKSSVYLAVGIALRSRKLRLDWARTGACYIPFKRDGSIGAEA
jgi:hypothetical protein